MEANESKIPHIVLVGGGFGGLEFIKKLKGKPFQVTVIDKNNYHTFQPLLYQVAAGGLGADAIAYPHRKVIGPYPNVSFRMANVHSVNTISKTLKTDIGEISYDLLVMATGSTTNFFGNKDLQSRCMELKSIPNALDLRSDILQEFEKALVTKDQEKIKGHLNFVIVGGGPTGVEMAGALAEFKSHVLPHDYKELDRSMMSVSLIEASPKLLASMSEQASKAAYDFLSALGVNIQLNTSVKTYDGVNIVLSTGEIIKSETVVWAAGVKGAGIEGFSAEILTPNGRLKVDHFNKVTGLDSVYAIGDIAAMIDEKNPKGHPMVAPVAIQQASNLAKNLLAEKNGSAKKEFVYNDKGSMATVGRHKAVVDIGKIKFQGWFAWFVWMFVHLMSLVGFRNRIIVLVSWMWNYLTYDRALRLIIRPFSFEKKSGD